MPDCPLPETHRVQRLIAPSRNTHTNWNDKDPVILEGVLGFTKDRVFNGSLEYFIGDGVHKYSELMKYAAAPASTDNDPNTLVLRDANGKIDSDSIDFPTVPDATPTVKGIVKASTTKAGDNVVKADANGALDGWKDAISDAVANPATGLVKNSDGTLGVDFDQMPTTKFEALLKSLKMQIPLEANLNLYVDKNSAAAADIIEDGRGTQVKPFKTIQAAVNFVTQTYAVGSYRVYIYIAEATYTENVRLPIYTRTSGGISLRALDNDHPPTITNNGAATTVLAATGGNWGLRRLNITGVFSDVGDGFIHTPSVVNANNSGTTLSIVGCNLSCSYEGAAPTNGGYYNPHIISATQGGVITLDVLAGYHNTITAAKGNAQVLVALYAERNAQIIMPANNTPDDSIMYNIPCSGTVSTFVSCIANSLISTLASGANFQKFTGTVTGNKYSITNSSGIDAPEDGFPGSVDSTNTVESATYCWYKERNS